MPARLLWAPLAATLAAVVLVGCSSQEADPTGPPLPDEASFSEGTCRGAAPDVLAVGRLIPQLGQTGDSGADGSLPQQVRDGLRDAQDRLFALAETAEPQVKAVLDPLVVQVGAVRIRADGNSYTPDLGEQLEADYRAVLTACTDSA